MKYENIIRCQFSDKQTKEIHFHQDIEILYILEGTLTLGFEDGSQFLDTDDFYLVNSNVRHEYQSDSQILLGSLFIDYTMLTEIFGGEQTYFLCNSAREQSESYEKMRYYIRQIFNYYQTTEGQGIILKNSIYYQLLYLVTTDFIVKKGMRRYDSLRGIRDERMNEILGFMMSNYREPIALKTLADRLYLSVPYLSRYIKNNFGMSFLKLLNNIRLENAVSDLLYTDKTIMKIAMDNGFPNLAGFNQVFKESYQMTPAEYRMQRQGENEKTGQEDNSKEILERVEQYLTANLVTAPEASDSMLVSMEADARERTELKRNWCRLINVGAASDLLRYDVREQVRYLKDTLGFEYIRFWNLLSEDMMVQMKTNRTKYNFYLIDQIFDAIKSLGLKPHIELGYKGKIIFSDIEKSILDIQNENIIFIMEKNQGFLEELVRHLVRRYGSDYVGEWYIELEYNAVTQKNVDIDQYFEAFDMVAEICKNAAPQIKVGGAGFALNYMGKEFPQAIRKWKRRKRQPDFISLNCFPYIFRRELLDAGRNDYSPDESYLYHQIREAKDIMKEEGFEVRELLVTEWSFTLSNRNRLNDGSFKAAYVMKNLIENVGEADSLGYWMASDIHTENIDSADLLYGGCGLVTKNGIRKPVYYTFSTMNHVEKYVLGKSKNAIITYNGKGIFFISCHNYRHFNFRYYTQKENEIEIENQQSLFEDNESRLIHFKIHNVSNGRYCVKTFSVNEEHGNIQTEWRGMEYFSGLSELEYEYLRETCQPKLSIRQIEVTDGVLELETRLAAQEIQGIVVGEL